MHHHAVVQELDVARLQVHRQEELGRIGELVHQVERLHLSRRERRRLRPSLRRLDVAAAVVHDEPFALETEHAQLVEALRTIAVAPVEPERLVQHLGQIRAACHDLVVQRGGADDGAGAAAPSRPHAQQTDDVGAVDVVVQAGACLVTANGWIGVVEALVAHVHEEISGCGLRDGNPDVEAEQPVGPLDLEQREPLDRHAT